ncbi:MAG TPA: thioredoxin family protein [Chitinophagales bacterium]|nr:thioredoxin family protein [Chitinophagales bacterium]
MKKTIAVVFVFIISFHFVKAQQSVNVDSAFAFAQQKNKMVLLIFSGSDWCRQCMRFEKKILSDSTFDQFADDNLVLLQADFPQSKKLPPQTVKQNEILAEKYNPAGSFPLIVLLRPDQKVLAYLNYSNEDSGDFIRIINRYLP